MDFIDKLRQKSPASKRRIALTTSAVVTLMIFGLWLTVFRFGIGSNSTQNTAAVANSADADVNPFSGLWNVFVKGWDGLSNNINQIKTGASGATNFMNGFNESTTSAGAGAGASAGATFAATSTATTPNPSSQSDVFILSQ